MGKQSRWKSLVAARATLAFVLFVMKNYYGYEVPHGDELIELILGLLIVYGFYNNPSLKNEF
jgi:hypothetical protein